jgi:hypothetical protein
MQIVKQHSAQSVALYWRKIGMRVKVEFGADRFSVTATAQWGFGASFSQRQQILILFSAPKNPTLGM